MSEMGIEALPTARGIDQAENTTGQNNYPEVFGFGKNKENFLEWLKGKKILDLGVGFCSLFYDLHTKYLEWFAGRDLPLVVSAEPFLAQKDFVGKMRGLAKKKMSRNGGLSLRQIDKMMKILPRQQIAARWPSDDRQRYGVQQKILDNERQVWLLPFIDKSFDAVLCGLSFPFWEKSRNSVVLALEELYRLLKDGGECRLSPIKDTGNVIDRFNYSQGVNVEEMEINEFVELAVSVGFSCEKRKIDDHGDNCLILRKKNDKVSSDHF